MDKDMSKTYCEFCAGKAGIAAGLTELGQTERTEEILKFYIGQLGDAEEIVNKDE